MRIVLIVALWVLSGLHVLGQGDDCPVLEQAAITETRVWCADLEAGQICYGNSPLSPTTEGFRLPGDRVNVLDLTSLIASRETGFGVSVIHTKAYSNRSWQPVDLTAILLGSVEITDLSTEGRTDAVLNATVTGNQGANVRSGTSTDFRVLASLFAGDLLKVTGVTAAGDWWRVQLPDGQTGWVVSDALQVPEGDVPVVTRDDAAPTLLYAPFTDIELKTGTQDTRCAGSPESGLLLQAPLESEVRLRVNGLEIAVQGTVFLQTEPDHLLTISTLEGTTRLQDLTAQSGFQIRVPFQVDSETAGTPLVRAYDFQRMAAVPTEMLPRYTYIGIDLTTIVTPAPAGDRSPIADVLATDACIITTGPGGANLRGGPGSAFAVRGVLAMRETARPISRAQGTDGQVWWELAQNVWISATTTVTGGDCASVPQSQRIPALPPTHVPEN